MTVFDDYGECIIYMMLRNKYFLSLKVLSH